ncbi:hypothetical protein ACXNAL_00195 [Kluyvera ascorbata]
MKPTDTLAKNWRHSRQRPGETSFPHKAGGSMNSNVATQNPSPNWMQIAEYMGDIINA